MVRREFFPPVFDSSPVYVPEWEMIASHGRQIGSRNPKLTIIEFVDFQCEACERFERTVLGPFRRDNPTDVSVVVLQWPLPYHSAALPMAVGAECAADQLRFEQFYDSAFRSQDSLGQLLPAEIARRAGITDFDRFERCAGSAATSARISRATALARQVGGSGTPTLVVQGWRMGGIPTRVELDSALAEARK
jgi:protein-disulfide isomerase